MARRNERLASLLIVLLALLSIGVLARVNNEQQPMNDIPSSNQRSITKPSSTLTPTSFLASTTAEIKTEAELATADIRISADGPSEQIAQELLHARLHEVEHLIQSLSNNSSSTSIVTEWTNPVYRRPYWDDRGCVGDWGCEDNDLDSRQQIEPASESFIARLELTLDSTDMTALKRVVSMIEGTEDIKLYSIDWQLTPETKQKVKQELRRDSLKALRAVASEVEDAFDISFITMDYYREKDARGIWQNWEERDDEGALKVGKVRMAMDVEGLFRTEKRCECSA